MYVLGITECILMCSINWCMTWLTTTFILSRQEMLLVDTAFDLCQQFYYLVFLFKFQPQFLHAWFLPLILSPPTFIQEKAKSNIFIVIPWFLSWSHYYKIKLINNNVHKLKFFKGDGGRLVWKIMMEWWDLVDLYKIYCCNKQYFF